jgi:hypothetical protein
VLLWDCVIASFFHSEFGFVPGLEEESDSIALILVLAVMLGAHSMWDIEAVFL